MGHALFNALTEYTSMDVSPTITEPLIITDVVDSARELLRDQANRAGVVTMIKNRQYPKFLEFLKYIEDQNKQSLYKNDNQTLQDIAGIIFDSLTVSIDTVIDHAKHALDSTPSSHNGILLHEKIVQSPTMHVSLVQHLATYVDIRSISESASM